MNGTSKKKFRSIQLFVQKDLIIVYHIKPFFNVETKKKDDKCFMA